MAQSKLTADARRATEKHKEVARNDMAIGLCGLFRVISKKCKRLEIGQGQCEQAWNGGTVKVQGVACDDGDLSALLAILFLALRAESDVTVRGEEAPPSLVRDRRRENEALRNHSLQLTTTISAVCRAAGCRTDGGGWRSLKASIERLASIEVTARLGARWATTQLLTHRYNEQGKVTIWLSFRLARVFTGESSYASVPMAAYRRLNSAPSRVIFAWLASWWGGSVHGSRKIGMEALEHHAYGNHAMDRRTRSKRRLAIRTALDDIQQAGCWSFTWHDDIAVVQRAPAN